MYRAFKIFSKLIKSLGNLNARRYLFPNKYFIFYWKKNWCVAFLVLFDIDTCLYVENKRNKRENVRRNKTEMVIIIPGEAPSTVFLYRYVHSGCLFEHTKMCLKNVTMLFIGSQFWEDHIFNQFKWFNFYTLNFLVTFQWRFMVMFVIPDFIVVYPT